MAWSNSALESPWVGDEAAEGRDRGVLASILLEQVQPPLGFRGFHAADLSHWQGQPDEEIEKLLTDVGEILGAIAEDNDENCEVGVTVEARQRAKQERIAQEEVVRQSDQELE